MFLSEKKRLDLLTSMCGPMKQRFDLLAKEGWTADLSTYPDNQIGLLTMVQHPKHGGPMFIADAFRKLGWKWY